ncbi:Potassium-transporting ATPase ATP-binding subunit [Streptomyces tendae]
MAGGLLTRSQDAVTGLVLAGPRLLARGTAPAVGAAAGAAAGTARAGVRGADFAARAARVARAALPGGSRDWRAGPRAHLALRPAATDRVRRAGGTERVGRRVAAALAEHPDVLLAYWDTGLARLVVTATEDTLTDRVVDHATELAERHGLTRADQAAPAGPDDPADEPDHPGDPAPVRVAATALGADVLGIAAAVTGARLRLPPSPRLVTAVATLLRENPAFRAWLRERLGDHRMDVALAAANAVVHGAGQSPTSLVLDGALRVCQLTEAVARGAAFEVVHDQLCVPGRDSLPAAPALRPPGRAPPGRPLADVVAELRAEGGVITVVRPLPGDDGSVSAGLLAGDVAVALADADCPVAWGADVLAPQGLADVWRVLRAVPVSRAVGSRSQTLARSGAALSGLLVAVGEARGRNRGGVSSLLGMRHAPVDASAAVALLSGTRAAIGVAMARAPRPRARVAWHALDPDDVRERLEREREPRPTAVEQAAARLRAAADRAGRVPVLAPVRWSWQLARAVRGELDDPLTPVLAVGSAASAILGSVVDALLVVGALDLNALVGGFQRLRAERALSGLLAEQKQKARVTEEPAGEGQPARDGGRFGAEGEQRARDGGEFAARGGEPRIVDAARLHPGHVIELKADDVVPADARLLWEDGLEVDESALTGESLPVDKCVDPAPRAPVAERYCMVFEGTTVVAGRARAVVVDTGDHTEAARAVALAARTPSAAGVQARLQELTRKALPLTLAGGAAVTGLSLLRGAPIRQAVAGGVSVAVAAVPEGLPLVATVAQLAAARRLSRRGVLVRTPRTLEALGRMDTVCFDKTGTLTENRLRLSRVAGTDAVRRVGDPEPRTVRVAARACPG